MYRNISRSRKAKPGICWFMCGRSMLTGRARLLKLPAVRRVGVCNAHLGISAAAGSIHQS
jgi:hypothetical protein